MNVGLRFAARSDVGLVRSSNQDSGYAGPHLLVLADGMGGPAGGDIASSVAIAHLAPLDDEVHRTDELLALLRRAVENAHDDLVERSRRDPDLQGLGTTCIAILRSGNKLAMVHIGDSRAYLLRDGALSQATTDHTFVQYLVDSGRLTSDEAATHPQRNVIMRALGDTEGEVELDESMREARIGDRWLLASDGLFGVVSSATIAQTLASVDDPGTCGDALVDLALRGGAPDNVTVVVADVVDATDSRRAPGLTPQVVGSAAKDHAAVSRRGGGSAGRAATLIAGGRGGQPGLGGQPGQAGQPARSDLDGGDDPGDGLDHDGGGEGPAAVGGNRAARRSGRRTAAGYDTTDSTAVGAAAGTARATSIDGAMSIDGTAGDDRAARHPNRGRTVTLLVLLAALLVGAVGYVGFRWTQTQYFVAESEGYVGIYRGIPQEIGSIPLSSLYERTDLPVSELTPLARERLAETITRPSLQDAQEVVQVLAEQRSTPTPDPADPSAPGQTPEQPPGQSPGQAPGQPTGQAPQQPPAQPAEQPTEGGT